jgi:LacI family transcriptional regulator
VTKSSGYDAVKTILKQHEPPTAIFASNDAMAIGALSALKEFNVDVPKDIAVVGFDDIPMAQYAHPRLTTVRFDLKTFGEIAMKRILEAINLGESHERKHILLDYELVIRDSCGSSLKKR